MNLSLARIYYPIRVLGPGSRVGIWLNGCPRKCEECASPEMRPYDKSREVSIQDMIGMIRSISYPIDGFTISGGEPFYDPAALSELVSELCNINDDMIIYTGYRIEELRQREDKDIDAVLKNCAVLIDGEYVKELNDNRGIRGSSNQRIHVFKYKDRYEGSDTAEREFQTVVYGNSALTIGIPLRSTTDDQPG